MAFTEEQKRQYDELYELGKKKYPQIASFFLDCMITQYVLKGEGDITDGVEASTNVYETNQTEYEYEGSKI